MKKTLTNIQKAALQSVVLVILLMGSGAKAQYPYLFSFAGIQLDSKSIVRSYGTKHVVVYHEDGLKAYVSLVNVVTNDVSTVPLAENHWMNDMCIMNDSVFLCGYELFNASASAMTGAIVAMNLNNFGTGTVLVTYFNPSYWMHLNLKRIQGFEYTTVFGIKRAKFLLVSDLNYPCDGHEPFPRYNDLRHPVYTNSNDHNSTCTVNTVVEASYPFYYYYSNNPLNQTLIRIMNPTDHDEVIHDVVVTANYVAFVGIRVGVTDSIILHICNKDNDVLRSYYPGVASDYDSYYRFPLGSSGGTPFYRACALYDDKIVIVTQDETNTPSNVITIRTIDLATRTMDLTQHLRCNAYPEFKDVTYIPYFQKLVLLFRDYYQPIGDYADKFCPVIPINAGTFYTMPGITDNVFRQKFGSLDAMKNGYFVTTGGKYGFVTDLGTFSPGRMCYDEEDYTIFKREVIVADTASFDYDQIMLNPDLRYLDTVCSYTQIPTRCLE